MSGMSGEPKPHQSSATADLHEGWREGHAQSLHHNRTSKKIGQERPNIWVSSPDLAAEITMIPSQWKEMPMAWCEEEAGCKQTAR